MDKLYWPIEKLKNWENNPRTINEKSFNRLKEQIKELGEYKPLIITDDGTVIGGNMRLRAYIDMEFKECWVSIVKADSEEEKIKYALSDNDRAGEYAEEQLANLLDSYPDLNLESYSLDLGKSLTVKDLLDKYRDIVEDEVPQVEEGVPDSKLGAIYQLGRHRLMCGDSTKIEDVEKLMDGKKADMVFTDPPYGVDYSSKVDKDKRKPWGGIINDDLEGEKLREFLYDSLSWLQCPKYVCCNWQSVVDFFLALGKPNSFIVWDKGSIGLGAGYRSQHEFILFYGTLDHNSESNVWSIDRDSTGGYEHPTQKPVAISARAIGNHEANNVLDLFGGSGSTLIACEQTNRTCYMMEIDPKYCDVIRKRYAKFIGKEAEWKEVTRML